MRMIPSQPLQTHSRAEQRVFDQLRRVFEEPEYLDWFALHSLNLPQHEYKRFGEIDFVLCGPEGLFVLEIKGGGVSCHSGIWETINRNGETRRLRESPFRQARSALHSLQKLLSDELIKHFVTGYGVIMPDVDALPESVEWDPATFATARDFRRFESWLEKFIDHWRKKDPHKAPADTALLEQLQKRLRPDFEALPTLHAAARGVTKSIARLTQDQYRLIDIVDANSRVVCKGGAGTGKTLLALELSRRWAAQGLHTVLVCHSPWLKHFLEQHATPNLTVSLDHSLAVTARRTGLEQFDALIVDEGQDLLNIDILAQLDRFVRGGLADGRWCFFHDINNQTGLCGSFSPAAQEHLESFGHACVPLTINCRNSRQILERIQRDLGADMGNAGVGDGPEVRDRHVDNKKSSSKLLEEELEKLVHSEGFPLGDIVVLSPRGFDESCASSLSAAWRNAIVQLDESSSRKKERNRVGFASISDFKGLESEVIILVDIPEPGTDSTLRSSHYVGMSRARALLSMILEQE